MTLQQLQSFLADGVPVKDSGQLRDDPDTLPWLLTEVSEGRIEKYTAYAGGDRLRTCYRQVQENAND